MNNEFKFYEQSRRFIDNKLAEYNNITKEEQKIFKKKYSFISRKSKLPLFDELVKYPEFKDLFTIDDIKNIRGTIIEKIQGIYKHAQSNKTYLCNSDIITYIQMDRFVICITKNTLSANSQWTSRFISDMKKKYPTTPLSELILVCSSQKNTLNGNATHCSKIDSVISCILQKDNYRVLFMCSNNTRVLDVLKLLNSYSNFSLAKQRKIILQYDEAHNPEEGIPSKREIVENILFSPHIERFTPCTASYDTLIDDNNTIWKKQNLDAKAIDYTRLSCVKSSDPTYSSLHDAEVCCFEDIEKHPNFVDYNISEFDADDFNHVDEPNYYDKKRKTLLNMYEEEGLSDDEIRKKINMEIKEDIDRRRQLEFTSMFVGEIREYNIGLNILNNIVVFNSGEKMFINNIKNIHVITTPCRVIFTYSLMKYAIKQSYNPILIGLYRGQITCMYKNNEEIVEYKKDIGESMGEMNENIYKIILYLQKKRINTEVPIIILGNYKPTGESITFVHYGYGPLRSSILLIEKCSPVNSNQALSRLNYMTTKFVENNPAFVPPPKIICSFHNNITNAKLIEKCNDDRIDEFCNREEGYAMVTEHNFDTNSDDTDTIDNNTNISIPSKLQVIDPDDQSYIDIKNILEKEQRFECDRDNLMILIEQCIKDGTIQHTDKTGKFNSHFKLKVVRAYRKHTTENNESTWRFAQYSASHNQNMPYINNKNKIGTHECELYACIDKYIHNNFTNSKLTMWLSYRYS